MCINLSILIEILFEKTTNYKIMFPIQIIAEIYNKYRYGYILVPQLLPINTNTNFPIESQYRVGENSQQSSIYTARSNTIQKYDIIGKTMRFVFLIAKSVSFIYLFKVIRFWS